MFQVLVGTHEVRQKTRSSNRGGPDTFPRRNRYSKSLTCIENLKLEAKPYKLDDIRFGRQLSKYRFRANYPRTKQVKQRS